MDENEVWWLDFWQRFEDRKEELVSEGKTWLEADVIAREEFDLGW